MYLHKENVLLGGLISLIVFSMNKDCRVIRYGNPVNTKKIQKVWPGKEYKFDFGSGRVAKGFIAVTPETGFDNDKGYGFDQHSEVEMIDQDGDPLTGDFITSKNLSFFLLYCRKVTMM